MDEIIFDVVFVVDIECYDLMCEVEMVEVFDCIVVIYEWFVDIDVWLVEVCVVEVLMGFGFFDVD